MEKSLQVAEATDADVVPGYELISTVVFSSPIPHNRPARTTSA